jgi:hypothetical protein
MSLEQLYLRLTLQSSKLDSPPYWGNDLLLIGVKTANVFARNIILYEIRGMLLIIIFALLNALEV